MTSVKLDIGEVQAELTAAGIKLSDSYKVIVLPHEGFNALLAVYKAFGFYKETGLSLQPPETPRQPTTSEEESQ